VVNEVLFLGYTPEPPAPLFALDNPPDLYQDIPVFFRLCTFLN
jgi:hypothetical protein